MPINPFDGPQAQSRRPTVLVVDDTPPVLTVVTRSLEQLGYATRAASTAREALTVLEADDRIAALVTDLQLPDLSGAELADRARRTRRGIPVLIMTASAGDVPGYVGRILRKPFTRHQLAAEVGRLVGTPAHRAASRRGPYRPAG